MFYRYRGNPAELYFSKANFVLAQIEEIVVAEMFGADIQNFGKLCCDVTRRRFSNRAFELSFSQRRRRILRAWFKPIKISSHWGTKDRLRELILMLNNLLK